MRGEEIRAAREARGWSAVRTIHALIAAADQHGVKLMTVPSLKVALSRWENGHTNPDALHSRLLAEVLNLPQPDVAIGRAREYQHNVRDAITVLDSLVGNDMDDDPALLASGDATTSPAVVSPDPAQVVTGYLFAQSPGLEIHSEPVRGVVLADRIRSQVSTMMSMDFQKGGGHVRRSLLRFFRDEVVPQLHAPHPERVRSEIFSAAAEVAQLLAWTAYDAGRHAAATRYFVQGLRLAEEGNDRLMGARLLANLSHQANFIGEFGAAVTYARAAQSALGTWGTPSVAAMCVMMEARGLASLSDQRGSAAVLHRAEHLFERRGAVDEPPWISYYDPAELAGDASHCFRDLGLAPQTRTFVTDALTDDTPPRTRALIQVVAGDAALIAGDLEEAGALAAAAIVNGNGLQSARYLRYLSDFRNRIPAGADQHPSIAEFTDLLHAHYPELASPQHG
ncbi:hypothetical protein [Nocardia wallacei]|uniref:hypothetical protein n=1 Tax=Nocardia wallacei TaxID=480035 RepID=UPI002454A80D|nr:hypothetical protein [Nocardia wallacei]